MQIISANSSQALNANSVSQDLRSREAQRVLSSVENAPAKEELQSDRAHLNKDRVTLSPEAAQISRLATDETGSEFVGLESSSTPTSTSASSTEQNKAEEQQELEITRELAQRDREVRAHERAHASVGGQYTTAPSYTYERGPDGRMYAVEGEVRIDTSPVPNDPQATLEKAEIIQRAALSVSEPSSADRAAASQARAMAAEARAEIVQQTAEESTLESEAVAQDDEEEADESGGAGEFLKELRDKQSARSEGAAEALNEFNDRMNDINKQLAEINKKLVDAGVFQKLFPEGSLLDQQI
jgi:hypothetical protein